MVYYTKRDHLKATDAWYKALNISHQMDNRLYESIILANLGNVYADTNQFEKALESYKKLLSISKLLKKPPLQVEALTNIGVLLIEKEAHLDKGILNLEQALALSLKENNKYPTASILNNMGLAYKKKKDYSKSLKYYNQALELAKEIENKYVQATALINMSHLNIINEDYKNAELNAEFFFFKQKTAYELTV